MQSVSGRGRGRRAPLVGDDIHALADVLVKALDTRIEVDSVARLEAPFEGAIVVPVLRRVVLVHAHIVSAKEIRINGLDFLFWRGVSHFRHIHQWTQFVGDMIHYRQSAREVIHANYMRCVYIGNGRPN